MLRSIVFHRHLSHLCPCFSILMLLGLVVPAITADKPETVLFDLLAKPFAPSDGASVQCLKDSGIYLKELARYAPWALQSKYSFTLLYFLLTIWALLKWSIVWKRCWKSSGTTIRIYQHLSIAIDKNDNRCTAHWFYPKGLAKIFFHFTWFSTTEDFSWNTVKVIN